MIKDHSEPRDGIERLAPSLRRFARALVARDAGDPKIEADALTREALARASGGGAQNPRIWLYATLVALNRARLRGRAGAAPARGKAGGQGVTDALSALPLDHREMLLLVVVEGLSYAEAADVLGVPRAVIAGRIARARSLLAERLDASRPIDERGKRRGAPYLRLVT